MATQQEIVSVLSTQVNAAHVASYSRAVLRAERSVAGFRNEATVSPTVAVAFLQALLEIDRRFGSSQTNNQVNYIWQVVPAVGVTTAELLADLVLSACQSDSPGAHAVIGSSEPMLSSASRRLARSKGPSLSQEAQTRFDQAVQVVKDAATTKHYYERANHFFGDDARNKGIAEDGMILDPYANL